MGKIHEILAVEEMLKGRMTAIVKETTADFSKRRELFTGVVIELQAAFRR